MKKILFTICILFVTTNAYAWGALEQGILWGIGGTLVGQHIVRDLQQPQPMYVQPGYPQGYYVPGYAPIPNRFQYRPMYRAIDIWVPECGCWRTILVQVN